MWNDQIFFWKRPNWRPKRTQVKRNKLLDNLVLDLMHAILDSWLKIPKKKWKLAKKHMHVHLWTKKKSKKSKVILWTASKSVARGQKEKKEINERHKMWQKRQRAGTEKTTNTTKSHNSLLRVHNIYLSTKAARILIGSMKMK